MARRRRAHVPGTRASTQQAGNFPPGKPIPYGGHGLGIPQTFVSPSSDEAPGGYTAGMATRAELDEAGFERAEVEGSERKSGEALLDELLVEGPQVIEPRTAERLFAEGVVGVLRDSDGKIVATWDEGRWWTPDESRQFHDALVRAREGER